MTIDGIIKKIQKNYSPDVQKRLVSVLKQSPRLIAGKVIADQITEKEEEKGYSTDVKRSVEKILDLENKVSQIESGIQYISNVVVNSSLIDDKLNDIENKSYKKRKRFKFLSMITPTRVGLGALWLPGILAAIAYLIELVKKTFSDVMTKLIDNMIAGINSITASVLSSIKTVSSTFQSVIDFVTNTVKNTIESILNISANFVDFVLEYVPEFLISREEKDELSAKYEKVRTDVSQTITQKGSELSSTFTKQFEDMQTTVVQTNSILTGPLQNLRESVQYTPTNWSALLFGSAQAAIPPKSISAGERRGRGVPRPKRPTLGTPKENLSAATAAAGSPGMRKLLDFAAKIEGGPYGYNALSGSRTGKNAPKFTNLTEMTIRQVLEYQRGMIERGHVSRAVGRYQFMPGTLTDLIDLSGISLDTLFTAETQDMLIALELKRRGYDAFLRGEMTLEEFQWEYHEVFASIPNALGYSIYDKDGVNRVLTTVEATQSALREAKTADTLALAPRQPNAPSPPVSEPFNQEQQVPNVDVDRDARFSINFPGDRNVNLEVHSQREYERIYGVFTTMEDYFDLGEGFLTNQLQPNT